MSWFSRSAGVQIHVGIARLRAAAVVAFALMAASCSSNPSPSAPAESIVAPTPSDEAAAAALVGTWERETRCEELVSELTEAGLGNWVVEFVAGNGFVPGVRSADQIADPAHPCAGAVPRRHSHFFTEDGLFGSLDWNGEPVDDGTYRVVDENTFVVSKEFPDVTFDFTVRDDTIAFEPLIPDCSPGCFEAAWSVSVAYPEEEWHRVNE
jgi:hypothetical protein